MAINEVIPFHIPTKVEFDVFRAQDDLQSGNSNLRATHLLTEITGASDLLLTGSCTQALEMAALLFDIKPDDEVIMPSFTFVSSANAFVLRGARIVFVDIDPATMNMDVEAMEAAITPNTRAILAMHYGGVSCDMGRIMSIAKRYDLMVVEDAAHCIGAFSNGMHLGTQGHLGALSFHSTKNIHCFEGGALLINDASLKKTAIEIYDKGTNRRDFISGTTGRYTWERLGLSAALSELSAAYLATQLSIKEQVTHKRKNICDFYTKNLLPAIETGRIQYGTVPSGCQPNGHVFFIKCADREERNQLANFLQQHGIAAYFHYVPLHSSPAGARYGRFYGSDLYTTRESERLLRLPLFDALSVEKAARVVRVVRDFYACS